MASPLPSDQPTTVAPRGVIYLSQIPRAFHPEAIRHFFGRLGPVTEVLLNRRTIGPAPTGRKKKSAEAAGRSGVKSVWSEGWVEFLTKKHAKYAAELLNSTPVQTSRRQKGKNGSNPSLCRAPDMWSIKYLRGVSWQDVMDDYTAAHATRQRDRHATLTRYRASDEEYRRSVARKRRKPGDGPVSNDDGGDAGGPAADSAGAARTGAAEDPYAGVMGGAAPSGGKALPDGVPAGDADGERSAGPAKRRRKASASTAGASSAAGGSEVFSAGDAGGQAGPAPARRKASAVTRRKVSSAVNELLGMCGR
eukprot:TRINITY_DN34782_c0_g1_i1.p1 TRINITY_DN34782_c0_g1~~TRINITY_DN34782_c0_g1_i1.p1  ORF type:complete len:326 (+),score=29.01 TRINITY_DN34782_c0_g1_i1:59-979(+)